MHNPSDSTTAATDGPRFILWDQRDGSPRRGDDGVLISDGVLGRMDASNVYLTIYAQYPDGAKRPGELAVGERIEGVVFALSGERGEYDVYRVA